jgi:hypothetical protein
VLRFSVREKSLVEIKLSLIQFSLIQSTIALGSVDVALSPKSFCKVASKS